MLKQIAPYAKPYRKQFILGPLFKLAEAVFELWLPFFLARLIDDGIIQHHKAAIYQNTMTILLCSLLGLVCVFICQYFASIASQGFGTELRDACLAKIQSLSQHNRQKLGANTLLTRLTSDVNQLQQAAAMLIRLVIRAPFLSIGAIIMAFQMNARLAWIFVIALPLFAALLAFIMVKTVPLFKQAQYSLDRLSESLSENLSGVRVIRSFNQQQAFNQKVIKHSQELADDYQKAGNISALLNPGTTLMVNCGIVALLALGAQFIQFGSLQPGELVAMINYMSQMLLAMIVIANLVVTFTKAKASGDRVSELLSLPEEDHSGAIALDTFKNADIEHLSYHYDEESGAALKEIHFHIQAGETIGIIGPTGSGKSTLVQLLTEMFQPTSGQIKINHQPLTSYTLTSWRRLLGVVPQKATLLTGTIRSNLCLAKEEATDADCWEALSKAQIADFVAQLPQKLDTPVERYGRNFSGGQRQRLAIARAFIRQPQILILDDSLSALDYQTDQRLRQELKTMATVIIVSQRISSIKDADKILVLDEGELKGMGTHHELLDHCELYRKLYLSQEGGKEDEFNDDY